ncbi:MAG: hypothetical protein BIP78_1230 [Candidatus Bipolaricaulis sibiricus]|uniref:Peptidase M20 dimerisation domain-containing protein n=1 Tax=Bipolaricaulis sibiricus TaxID=2501609 RepID=A0A410FVA0_BIPS1|nr:MAG: hypothetical protein BIP78_1230 [Candidatus Bipolaricaulis sibiricus]
MSGATGARLIGSITPAEVRRLAHELVLIPSHSAVGTAEVAHRLRRFLSGEGVATVVQPAAEGPHVNLLAGYPEPTDAPFLLLNGHLDTVPPPSEGRTPAVRGRLLFGRGAADMKAGVAAMAMALVALQRGRFPLRRPVMLAAVAGEEIGGLGTKALLSEVTPQTCIVGEPTRLRLVTAHKGVEWVEIVVEGRAAHASCPQIGANSVVWAAAIVQALAELGVKWAEERTHPLLGAPTLSVGMIQGGVAPNVVPDRCWVRLDRRWLPSEDIDAVLAEIRMVVARAIRDARGVTANVRRLEETRHCRPMETRSDHPFVRALQGAAREEGLRPELQGVPYGTDGSLFAERRVPTVVWGPGDIAQAHGADEHVDLDEVWSAARAYLRAIVRVCAGEGRQT